MSLPPTHQKALFLSEVRGEWYIESTDTPQPAAEQVLVRLEATALNPIDWKFRDEDYAKDFDIKFPAILGYDGAGVVVKLGDNVTGVAVGDRIIVDAHISNPATTTFQQYAITFSDLIAKIPANVSVDEAATLPTGLTTAAIGFYGPRSASQGSALVAPWKEGGRGKYTNQPIFIIGGATSVGQAAIQLARLSGFSPIITTASLSNDAYLKSLGVTHTIDRALPLSDLAANISKITKDPITLVLDTISIDATQSASYDVLAPGGTLLITLPSKITDLVDGKKIFQPYGNVHPPLNRTFGVELWAHMTELLENGDVKPNRVDYVPGGLSSIPAALDRLRKNQVSGKKVVVHPAETV